MMHQVGYRGGDLGAPRWVRLEILKRFEIELGNAWFDDSGIDLENVQAIWVTHDKKSARKYGRIQQVDLTGAICVHRDNEGGFIYIKGA